MKNLDTSNREYINKLKQVIYRNIQKSKQDKINNELKNLRFNKLAIKIILVKMIF